MTAFVNQQVNERNAFAGFVIGMWDIGGTTLVDTDALGRSSLVIETVDAAEAIPEPTAIFGLAIGLCLGG